MSQVRLILTTLAVALVFALGLAGGITFMRMFQPSGPPPKIQTTPEILKQVQTLAQLVTVKYVLEKAVVLEDVKWYGENRVLMVAHGIVKAGVDLSQLKPGDIEVQERKMILRLPRAVITDVYLDEAKTEVLESKTGLLRAADRQLEQSARRQALESIARAARNNGILKDAEERAATQLRLFFYQAGFDQVECRPSEAAAPKK